VLLCEPHDDISALLELVVRRLGHHPVSWSPGDRELPDIDAAVIEPGDADGLVVARRMHAEGVPVVFTSIFPPDETLLALDPIAYLVKPFPLSALERALSEALGRPGEPDAGPAAAIVLS